MPACHATARQPAESVVGLPGLAGAVECVGNVETPRHLGPRQSLDPRPAQRWRLATINVNGMVQLGKWGELAVALAKEEVDVAVLQETRCPQVTNRSIGERGEYTVWTTPLLEKGRSGVGIAVSERGKKWLDGGKINTALGDRVMVVVTKGWTLVGVYGPTNDDDRANEEKDQFDVVFRATLEKYRAENRIVAGDFNATMQLGPGGTTVGKNENGGRVEAWAEEFQLELQNWKWGTENTWTWGGTQLCPEKRTLDWIAMSEKSARLARKCKVVDPEGLETDHRMVVMELEMVEEAAKTGKSMRKGPAQRSKAGKIRHVEGMDNAVVERRWNEVRRLAGEGRGVRTPPEKWKTYVSEGTKELVAMKHVALRKWREERGKRIEGKEPEKASATEELCFAEFKKVKNAAAEAMRRDRMEDWEKTAGELEGWFEEGKTAAVYQKLRKFYRPRPKRRGYQLGEEELEEGLKYFQNLLTQRQKIPPSITPMELVKAEKYEVKECRGRRGEKVVVYTDGSYKKEETGEERAGYGVYFPKGQRELAGRVEKGEQGSYRGEVRAVLAALEQTEEGDEVEIVTDCKAVEFGMIQAKTSWRVANYDGVVNADLWREIGELLHTRNVKVRWVRSHQLEEEEGPGMEGGKTGKHGRGKREKRKDRKGEEVWTREDLEGNARADTLANLGRDMGEPKEREKGGKAGKHYQMGEELPDEEEVRRALAKMKATSAPGADGITAEMLRSSKEVVTALVELIREVWECGKVPKDWTTAKMIAIPKKTGAREWTEHRGITLLSVASKVLARILLERAASTPMGDWQHGFRRARSTVLAIGVVRHLIDETRRTKKPCCIAFLDICKAYDCIDRKVLWETMQLYGFGEKARRIVQQLYDDEVIVQVEGQEAGTFQSEWGVRQGCILSPYLFNIVLDRAVESAWPEMKGMEMRREGNQCEEVKVIAYADDMAVVAETPKDLERNLAVLAEALAAVGMVISVAKSKVMLIQGKEKEVRKWWQKAYAAQCDKELARKKGAEAGEMPKAEMKMIGEKKIVEWRGICLCPKEGCKFLATAAAALRSHLLRKHKESTPVWVQKVAARERRRVERKAGQQIPERTRRGRKGRQEANEEEKRGLCKHRCKDKKNCRHTCCKKTPKEVELEKGEEGVEGGEEGEGGGEAEGGGEESLEEVGKTEAEDGGTEPEWQEKVEVAGAALEVVTEFRYLGRILSQEGGRDKSEDEGGKTNAGNVVSTNVRKEYSGEENKVSGV